MGKWSAWTTTCTDGVNKRSRQRIGDTPTFALLEETRVCGDLHDQCYQEYTTLSDSWREIDYKSSTTYDSNCDNDLVPKWYRFVFKGTNAMIPTEVAPTEYRDYGQTCRTYFTGWMDGRLPALGESPQNVRIKFTLRDGSTKQSINAKVVTCVQDQDGPEFYLYQLSQLTSCNMAYCATTKKVNYFMCENFGW